MTLSRRDFVQMLGGVALHTVINRAKPVKPPRRRKNVIVSTYTGGGKAGGIRASITGNVIPLPPGTQVWPVSLKTGA